MVSKLGELIETANSKIREAEEALTQSKKSLQQAEEATQKAELAKKEGVSYTAEQIGAILAELSKATGNLADEVKALEERTENQQGMISNTASAIDRMNTIVLDMSRATTNTAELAENARTEAHSGKILVLDVVANMGHIEKQSLFMKTSMEELGSKAADIGKIISIINDVADQTNLLALNAAIEAARAGEAGRGFAVVADEVRKLAEKTMEATKQVGTSIKAIQDGTSASVTAMQEAASYISTSTQVAHKAGEALTGIEGIVNKTAEEVHSIAKASEEQSASTEEINQRTEAIKEITAQVSESTRHSNTVVVELLTLSKKLTSVVDELQKD
jgi:methyl-accepting chemotaxis protein